MKKKRGLRRYFRSLDSMEILIPPLWFNDGYFTYDRLWVDHYGFKKTSQRKAHLACLIRNYDRLAQKLSGLNMPFQLWILINEHTGKEDCLVLHSPNPISAFPHTYPHLDQEPTFSRSSLLSLILEQEGFSKRFGTSLYLDDHGNHKQEHFCVLFKDHIGVAPV